MPVQRLADQGGQGRVGGAVQGDGARLRPDASVAEIVGRRIGVAPRSGVGVEAAPQLLLEQQVVVPADHQGAVGQGGQHPSIARHPGVAHHQGQVRAVRQGRQLDVRPFARIGDRQPVAAGLGIGVQRVRAEADDAQPSIAEGQFSRRRRIGLTGSRVDDVADDGDPQAAHPRDHLMQVRRQVVVVVAQVDHRRGDGGQGGQEGPVDRAFGAYRDDVAVLEDVAVDRDQMRNRPAADLGAQGGQQLGAAFIGRVQVGHGQDAADHGGRPFVGERRRGAEQRQGGRAQHEQATGGGDEGHGRLLRGSRASCIGEPQRGRRSRSALHVPLRRTMSHPVDL